MVGSVISVADIANKEAVFIIPIIPEAYTISKAEESRAVVSCGGRGVELQYSLHAFNDQ
jgi:hypothetical protein